MHSVSVTGGPFEVYDVTGNSYNVFPPPVVKNDYRLRENIKREVYNTGRRGGKRLNFFTFRLITPKGLSLASNPKSACYSLNRFKVKQGIGNSVINHSGIPDQSVMSYRCTCLLLPCTYRSDLSCPSRAVLCIFMRWLVDGVPW